MDRLDSMSILLTVVDAGSLSAAARRLNKPLTTISRKISDLETHLNTRLLNRSSRKLDLTDAGRSYVAACKRILDDVQEAERIAAGEFRTPKGDLVITAPVVFGRLHVLPVVVAFLQAYPDIDVRMVLADRIVDLQDDHVDLAVRIGELPDSRMMAIKVGDTRRVICASPSYLSRHGVPRTLEQLASSTCITFESTGEPARWILREGQTDHVVDIRSRLVVNTAEAAIDACLAGLGITRVLSYQVDDARRAGHLETVLDSFESRAMPVSMVYAGQGMLPQKLRAFLDFAAPRLKSAIKTIDT